METQATNSVKHMLDRGTLVLMALDAIKSESLCPDQELGNRISGCIKRHELMTTEQRLALADYILEYHVNYREIAAETIDQVSRLVLE
jgi:hypothetical protein